MTTRGSSSAGRTCRCTPSPWASAPFSMRAISSSLSSRTRLKTLSKQTIDDNARFFERREDVPVYAITMGVGTILDARQLELAELAHAAQDAVQTDHR